LLVQINKLIGTVDIHCARTVQFSKWFEHRCCTRKSKSNSFLFKELGPRLNLQN